jgi:uncharacterized protein YkwD
MKLAEYINDERSKRGIDKVILNCKLSEQSQRHTDDMQINNFTSHIGSDGSDYIVRIKRSGISCDPCGEIILKGPGGKNCLIAAIDGWMGSPQHRSILLDRQPSHIGIGISLKNSIHLGNYFCVLFVYRSMI